MGKKVFWKLVAKIGKDLNDNELVFGAALWS